MDQNRMALLALHFIPGIGDHLIRQLVSYCGSADNVFKTTKGRLLKIPGIGDVTADGIRQGQPFKKAEAEYLRAQKDKVELLFYTDPGYPSRLRQIEDAPTLLYTKGNINFEAAKTVAIIGTRRATDYGRQCVMELIAGLVSHQTLIVSGLAYGIDIIAHREAVRNNLPTVGILGSGIDVIYPPSHADVVRSMLSSGGIVTENPFKAPPDAHNFPARNRVIAGLSDAVVVVEAAERGGALITADIANSYNKEVFAFPGNIGRSFSTGCNNLIKSNSAHLISGIKDLEYLMNWDISRPSKVKQETISLDQYSAEEQIIIKTLLTHNGQLQIDELCWRSAITIGKLATVLLSLELKGVVSLLPGKIYKLKVTLKTEG